MAVDRAQGSGSYGSSRTVLVASLVGLVLAVIGISVLIDKEGGQKLLASFYDILGNTAGAEALRNGQGDQFFAKLLLVAIALLVGVGGIWLLFTSLSLLVERLRPRLRDRTPPADLHRTGGGAARDLSRVSGDTHRDRQLPGRGRRLHARQLGEPRHTPRSSRSFATTSSGS